jgi:hypothetical protein
MRRPAPLFLLINISKPETLFANIVIGDAIRLEPRTKQVIQKAQAAA